MRVDVYRSEPGPGGWHDFGAETALYCWLSDRRDMGAVYWPMTARAALLLAGRRVSEPDDGVSRLGHRLDDGFEWVTLRSAKAPGYAIASARMMPTARLCATLA